VTPFPATFHIQDIATNGAVIDVRVGGHGPAVVLLHGYGDTGVVSPTGMAAATVVVAKVAKGPRAPMN
jgi:hypothetical protein